MTLIVPGLGWLSLIGVDTDLLTGFLLPSVLFCAGLGTAAVAVLAATTSTLRGSPGSPPACSASPSRSAVPSASRS